LILWNITLLPTWPTEGGKRGGILSSRLVTVANSYADPQTYLPTSPLTLSNQVLSEHQLDMQNSLLAREKQNCHSDFWRVFFPRKRKTKLQLWYLALIAISMKRNRKC